MYNKFLSHKNWQWKEVAIDKENQIKNNFKTFKVASAAVWVYLLTWSRESE